MKTKNPQRWLELVGDWGDNIAKHEGKAFEPTLRFPLAPRLPLEAQSAGWFRWLESRMALERRALSLIMPADLDSDVGQLTVIARETVPDDFLLLTSMWKTLPYVDDLCGAGGSGSTEEALEVSGGEAPPQAGGSWVDFVLGESTAT
jgi:hypothetical protein